MRLQTLPTRPYWAVFSMKENKPLIVAMFILQLDAKDWVKAQQYAKDEVIIKRVFCEVKVDVDVR